MAIAGHNFYLDGVKQNDTLVPVGDTFEYDGLASGTTHPSGYLVAVTNVDGAGNESPASSLTVKTLDATSPPVVEGPLSGPDQAAVDAIVAASMVESKQPGVIVAITGPRGYYSKAYGKTAPTGRALTVDDHFRTASGAKTFTTTAFWMAVDQGLVTLDDVLEDYVPGVPQGDVITMRNMLQMRSGVFEYTSGSNATKFVLTPTVAWSEAQTLAVIRNNPSQFPPGTKYAYANSNYALIGAVVEAVDPAHRTIRTIIQDDILAPLGMTQTKWPVTSAGVGDPAIPSPAMSTNKFNPDILGPAGGFTTTVGDYIKWAQAMRDGTLISPESLNAWHSLSNFVGYPAGFDDPPPTQFGYGFGQESTGTWFGHNGSWTGFGTQVAFDSVSGACMAVAENAQTIKPVVLAAYTRIFRKIAKYLYPDSMAEQDYLGNIRSPLAAQLSLVRGVPDIIVTAVGVTRPNPAALTVTGSAPTVALSNNKLVTPTGAVLRLIGGSGAGNITPSGSTLHVTGSAPTVSVAAGFSPFNEQNINRTNQARPAGTTGCWVTAIGGGAGGGAGRRNTTTNILRGGGGGGGGGAKVDRVFVPVASLGSTYSTTRGLKGTGGATPSGSGNGGSGADGTDSVFTSGSVSITAGGGNGGNGGSNAGGAAGTGGTVTVSGVTATTSNGKAGSAGSTSSNAGDAPDTTLTGAGGGGGGGGTTNSDVGRAGGDGGSTPAQTGGGGGAAANPGGSPAATASGVAGGGGGGGGGSASIGNSRGGTPLGFGGGGGGGGATRGTVGNVNTSGGDGADGYLLVEWV